MVDLCQDFGAVFVDSRRKCAVALDLAVIPESGCRFKTMSVWCYVVILCDDQAKASFCLLFMVGKLFFCGGTIIVAVICHHRRYNHTVLQFHPIDRNWAKYMI